MKKIAAFWNRLPRALRTLIQIIAILLCLVLAYLAAGSPAFTKEMEYRQWEKSHMMGPSTILGTESVSTNHANKVMIGKDDTHLMFCTYTDGEELRYFSIMFTEKYGNLNLLAAWDPYNYQFRNDYNFTLPLILYDECPEAVRAEVEFTLYAPEDQSTSEYKYDFFLESTRTNDGYFYFEIEHKAHSNPLYTNMLLSMAYISHNFSTRDTGDPNAPITVRLYDKNNQLIVDRIIYFPTIEENLPQ